MKIYLFLALAFSSLLVVYGWKDSFYEELYIKPLQSGHVYSYFQFTTLWEEPSISDTCENSVSCRSARYPGRLEDFNHCRLFPRVLGEILQRYNVEELHLSLTGGIWRHEVWGYPVVDAPPGAELRVWFQNGTSKIDEKWRELASSLSGLLCASLNFIDHSNSIIPQISFRPTGAVGGEPDSSLFRYGSLPQEIVCTENLTPWKKLLPCDAKKGLAALLNAGYIHNTNYHSLGIHLRSVCQDKYCLDTSIELKQTVSLVHDLVIVETGSEDFSLRKLYGSGLNGACPLASLSKIYFETTSNETDGTFSLIPPPSEKLQSARGNVVTKYSVYDIKTMHSSGMFNIALTYKGKKLASLKRPPPLFVHRYLSGYGQQKGGVVTKLVNRCKEPLKIVFLENIPWFLPIYLHSLKIVSNDVEIKPTIIKYIPGRQRMRPTYLELLVVLPPKATTTISVDMDFVFLKWQEYPPDASHGFYVGSATITTLLPTAVNYTGLPIEGSLFLSSFNKSERDGYVAQLRTEALIITLPTPDFSMPYNVICLACTVVALAFGPIHNITTKRLRVKEVSSPQGFMNKLLKFLPLRLKPKTAAVPESTSQTPTTSTS